MMKPIALCALALSAFLPVPFARAEAECEVPMVDWRPKADLMKMAGKQGWTVERMRTDDGCYLVYAKDARGQPIKAWIQPMTLEVLAEQRGDETGGEDHDE